MNKTMISKIFNNALKEKRNVLYEFEVYEVLKLYGLEIPEYEFITDVNQINNDTVSRFNQKVVIKVVSKDIPHKNKVGGVKLVNVHDPLFVKFVINEMENEILSHYNDKKPEIAGYLLVEFVEFSQSIGHEILFGISQDRAFGPTVTLSKGGDDAEFFSKYYDPANVFLPYLDRETSIEMVNRLKVKHKFIDNGHPEYLDLIAKGVESISRLAYDFSPVSDVDYGYYILSLDVNPFVITKKGRFIAVDGYCEFVSSDTNRVSKFNIDENNLDLFFKPKGIAVIGVSSDEGKYSMGREIANLLHDLKRDDLYLVNVKGGTTKFGNKEYNLYKSLEDVPVDVDFAVYTAPSRFIKSFFSQMNKRIPKAVVLIPGIPSEVNYAEFERQLNEVVKKGIRVVGPNCMGVYYGPDNNQKGLNTLFIDEERLKVKSSNKSNTVILTQSGGMAITMLDSFENVPIFKSIVSFGNKYDVQITDLLSYFGKEKDIEVITLYVEGFDNLEGRMFYELVNIIDKPVIVYKGGKTETGAKMALSHTAAMTGDYEIFKAACNLSKAILIEDVKVFYDSVKTFSLLSKKKIRGRKVAGVLNAGFEATIAADELGNLEAASVSEKTYKRLSEINTHKLADVRNSILDVTPMTGDKMYGEFIEAFLEDDNVDGIFISVLPHVENIKSTPETCHHKDSLANIIIDIFNKTDKPLVVSVNAGEFYKEFVEIMEKAGVPVFSNIRSAVNSLDIFIDWHLQNKIK